MDEFDLIRRYFARHAQGNGVIEGVGDDGAVLAATQGYSQVQVVDTLVEGVHFPSNVPAADIGYRCVAVNLSDIAAMGALPRFMTLALTLWDKDESWVESFADGLFEAADEFGVRLVGGDTTQGDSVVVSIHVTGEVEEGSALLRSGAQVGDAIYVSGTPGDAAAGLALLKEGVTDDALVRRFLRPTPRVELGRRLRGDAHAAIDISDGLVADLRKLLDASSLGARLEIDRIPLSAALRERFDHNAATGFALTGGDDYELCITAPPGALDDIDGITAIATVTEGDDLECYRDGQLVDVDDRGYRHFT